LPKYWLILACFNILESFTFDAEHPSREYAEIALISNHC
jgi:hypothetical protein